MGNETRDTIPYARPSFTAEDLEAAAAVMRERQWLQGEATHEFEQAAAAYQGCSRSVFVNSGSSALLVAAHALAEWGLGDVIVPAVQFPTLTSSVIHAGFHPVIVDIDDTLTIDPRRVEDAITPRTRGIAVVHTAGNVGHLQELRELAEGAGCWLLEDNCDGFGGELYGKKVGGFGTVSVTSLHVAHILSTGQGGLIFSDNDALANACVSYRDWGRRVGFDDTQPGIPPLPADHMQRYTYERLGFNLAPLELQAVLGLHQLKRLDAMVAARRRNYHAISLAAAVCGFKLPDQDADANPAWFATPFATYDDGERAGLFRALRQAKIEYRNILSGRLDLHPAFRGRVPVVGELPVADAWGRRGLWVSCHSSLRPDEIDRIAQFFSEWAR